nr:hypothetical protein Q903MT_gene4654 [Picea sitchensis]
MVAESMSSWLMGEQRCNDLPFWLVPYLKGLLDYKVPNWSPSISLLKDEAGILGGKSTG